MKVALLALVLMMWPFAVMGEGTLRLATVDNFPPFSFTEQGELKGVDVDVIKEVGRRLGIEIVLEVYPWVRVVASVREGSIDGGFAAFLTEERQGFCLYTGILHYEEFHVFVQKGREFSFSGLEDLYGKTIGTDIGVYVSPAFEKAVREGKIIVEKVNDVDLLNLKKLSLGRMDAMIGDYGVTVYHAKKMGIVQDIASLGPVHEKQAAYLILSKKSKLKDKAAWQIKMRTTISNIWEDGTYEAILSRYASIK